MEKVKKLGKKRWQACNEDFFIRIVSEHSVHIPGRITSTGFSRIQSYLINAIYKES